MGVSWGAGAKEPGGLDLEHAQERLGLGSTQVRPGLDCGWFMNMVQTTKINLVSSVILCVNNWVFVC